MLSGAIVLLILLIFFAGRWHGKSVRQAQQQEISELSLKIEDLEFENIDLSQRLESALAQATRVEADKALTGKSAKEANAQVKQLQQRVRELEKDLSFFKNVMSPEAEKSGLQIEKFVAENEANTDFFTFKLSLTQAKKHNSYLNGSVFVRIHGRDQQGDEKTINLEDIAESPKKWNFKFKYLQNISGRFALPEGFKPSLVKVTAKTKGKKPLSLTQEFVWQVTEIK